MENLHMINIVPPKFNGEIDSIRLFFVRFEIYRNCFNQLWDQQLTLNMLCNLIDNKTLLIFASYPAYIHNNYERTKACLIAHFDSGKMPFMLWNELQNRQQGFLESYSSCIDGFQTNLRI